MTSTAIVAVEFDAGHDVLNPHDHHYRVEVNAVGPTRSDGPTEGMVVDFRLITRVLTEHVKRPLEGRMIVGPGELSNHDLPDEERYDFPTRPTAELMARWAYEQLVENLSTNDAQLIERVTVWETPYAAGSYQP